MLHRGAQRISQGDGAQLLRNITHLGCKPGLQFQLLHLLRSLEASCFTSLCLIHSLLYKAVLSQGLSEWRRTAEKDMIPDCKDVLQKIRFLLSKISRISETEVNTFSILEVIIISIL